MNPFDGIRGSVAHAERLMLIAEQCRTGRCQWFFLREALPVGGAGGYLGYDPDSAEWFRVATGVGLPGVRRTDIDEQHKHCVYQPEGWSFEEQQRPGHDGIVHVRHRWSYRCPTCPYQGHHEHYADFYPALEKARI